ncbi:MAG: hypothetical protein LBU07_07650 [Coriobacteriales bacterium]|jgi:hypothetical protein|nr:hypothetical protein [Coriobacteriales bacterium]
MVYGISLGVNRRSLGPDFELKDTYREPASPSFQWAAWGKLAAYLWHTVFTGFPDANNGCVLVCAVTEFEQR